MSPKFGAFTIEGQLKPAEGTIEWQEYYTGNKVISFYGEVNEVKNRINGHWVWHIRSQKNRFILKRIYGVTDNSVDTIKGTFFAHTFAKNFWDWVRLNAVSNS